MMMIEQSQRMMMMHSFDKHPPTKTTRSPHPEGTDGNQRYLHEKGEWFPTVFYVPAVAKCVEIRFASTPQMGNTLPTSSSIRGKTSSGTVPNVT
jgi:hypothetical protein